MTPSKVPNPLDFLAEWGLEPVNEETDRLYWAYELALPGDGFLIIEFCGMERWAGTTSRINHIENSISLDQLVDLRFEDLGGVLKTLVGRFNYPGRDLRLEISNSEIVSVILRPQSLDE